MSRLPEPLFEGGVFERQRRANDVRMLYPKVDIASLAVDEKECPICNLEYGDSAEACRPLATTCCPPNKLGSICLLRWFCDENKPGCPFCRADLDDRIALM